MTSAAERDSSNVTGSSGALADTRAERGCVRAHRMEVADCSTDTTPISQLSYFQRMCQWRHMWTPPQIFDRAPPASYSRTRRIRIGREWSNNCSLSSKCQPL